MTPQEIMVSEAALALDAFGRNDIAAYDLHRLNARRIAEELDLQVVRARSEERAEVVA